MPANAAELMRSYRSHKAIRLPWESTWQAIADTCLPAYNDIQTTRAPGNTRTQRIFDTTGMHALSLFVDHINGEITNFQMSWFGLRMAYTPLNMFKRVKLWLEDAGKVMIDKLSSDTTPQSFAEYYMQFAGFGTACMFADEVPLGLTGSYNGMMTRSLPIGTYCLADDALGTVDSVYRDLELSPRQAVQHFGYEALHPSVQQALQRSDLAHLPAPYVHCVWPRSDRDPSYENQANMPYASAYVDVQHEHLCSEGGYRWFPYMTSRWQKLRTWNPYGFGPTHIALPEILTLNRMDKDVLTALQMHILPPWWTDDPDAVGRVLLLPGYVNPIAKGAQIQAMRAPGDFNISHLGMEERRQRIRQILYVDQLLALASPDAPGRMTAYEVSQRQMQRQKILGPALMRLLGGLLNPFIDIQFGLMLERGDLPEPPDEVYEAALQGHGQIKVDYQGPLARAQRGDEVLGIEAMFSMAERYTAATQDQSVWDNIDIDESIRITAEVYGAPPRVSRDADEVAKQRQARAEAQQAQQEQQQLIEGAKALGPASQMVKALQPAPAGAA